MTIMAFICMGYYTKIILIQKDTELHLQATTLGSSVLEHLLSEKTVPIQNKQKEGVYTINYHTNIKDKFMFVDVVVQWQSLLKTPKSITLRSGFVPHAGELT